VRVDRPAFSPKVPFTLTQTLSLDGEGFLREIPVRFAVGYISCTETRMPGTAVQLTG